MPTDRQRVEEGIIPALILAICNQIEDLQETEEEKATYNQILEAMIKALWSPTADLDRKKAGQIHRRIDRLYQKLAEVLDGSSNAQASMSVYYLLESLLQEEMLVIYEGSEFGNALETFLESIQGFFQEARLDQAAQKRARKMRAVLAEEGYF